ncbi:MAG: PilZ domain-containing protein [Acidobacteriota bacterium]|nr:PilZ domain-containing protein [Acidobacteriota bacterium]
MARHEVCLEADLSLLDAHAKTVQGQEESFQIFGNTRDLSEAGVSLIVPLVSIDERYCNEEERTLPLTLYLPVGQVYMQVAPVRCQPIDEKEPGKGFLMGAEITGIDEAARARLREYLRSISA